MKLTKKRDLLKELLLYAGFLMILYLFYKSIWVLTLLLPCIVLYRRVHRKDSEFKRKAVLNAQFKDMLESLAGSLRAGYSAENALEECLTEMKSMHGEDSPIYEEVKRMVNEKHLGMSVEEVLSGFASRSRIEDVETFASAYSIALRSGGDMVEIAIKSAEDIGAKIDTGNEIDVLISSRKMEMKIMSLIPIGIIVYMDFTTDGLLDPLYGNLTGVLIMTVCLILYAGAVLLAGKIVNIEV